MEASVIKIAEDSTQLHICAKCHEEKPISSFYKNKRRFCQGYCIDCSKEYNHKYIRTKTPEQRRKNNLITSHGIAFEDYIAVLKLQNNCCAICHKELNATGNNSTRVDTGYVDHNHATGKLRGILCHYCNFLLGNCKDSIEILRNAITYLEIHRF